MQEGGRSRSGPLFLVPAAERRVGVLRATTYSRRQAPHGRSHSPSTGVSPGADLGPREWVGLEHGAPARPVGRDQAALKRGGM